MLKEGKDEAVKELKAMFDKYDTDKSGTLSLAELKFFAAQMGKPLDESELKAALDEMDTSKTGEVHASAQMLCAPAARARLRRLGCNRTRRRPTLPTVRTLPALTERCAAGYVPGGLHRQCPRGMVHQVNFSELWAWWSSAKRTKKSRGALAGLYVAAAEEYLSNSAKEVFATLVNIVMGWRADSITQWHKCTQLEPPAVHAGG